MRIDGLLADAFGISQVLDPAPATVSDYGVLARLGQVSSARICQFMTLLHLAPAIQENLLYTTTAERIPRTEPALRKIAREPRWDRQRAAFEAFLREVIRPNCCLLRGNLTMRRSGSAHVTPEEHHA